jgi:hypothetical protein
VKVVTRSIEEETGYNHALFACSIHIRGISIGNAANPRKKFGAIACARF